MEYAIKAAGLRKRYGDHDALTGLDLEVRAGTVLGVLGPNGAGKTTTVRVLSTLITPDEGRAEVAGFDVERNPHEVRSRIGLTGQYAAVDAQLTGRENLVLIGTLYHLGSREAKARATDLLDRLELTDVADRLVRTYSGGMRRRLDLAASLLADPVVLFLDEPTTGLDPTSRAALWRLIREQVDRGVSLLLTTQYLEEADELADRIAVVDGGTVIAEGTADELKSTVGGERLHVKVADKAQLPEIVRRLGFVASAAPKVDIEAGTLSVPLDRGFLGVSTAATALNDSGIEVSEFAIRRPSLDEVFFALTGTGRQQERTAA